MESLAEVLKAAADQMINRPFEPEYLRLWGSAAAVIRVERGIVRDNMRATYLIPNDEPVNHPDGPPKTAFERLVRCMMIGESPCWANRRQRKMCRKAYVEAKKRLARVAEDRMTGEG